MKIKTLSQFIIELEEIERKRLRGSDLYFRGHENVLFELQPSLFRSERLERNEHILFKEMILENPNEFQEDSSTLEKLVRMQHFGVPTRILDITKNPLVALFFACCDQNGRIDTKCDGEVVVLQIPERDVKYYDSDAVSILSNLCKLKPKEKAFNTTLDKKLFNNDNNDTGDGNIYKLVHAIREEKSYFSNLIDPEDMNRIFCVKVKKNNRRIIIQDGLFLIFGLSLGDDYLSVKANWIVAKNPSERLLIDKDCKSQILKELDRLNITQKSMFPDIENSARMLKKRYS